MSSIEHFQLLQQFKAQLIKTATICYKRHGTVDGTEPEYGEFLENHCRTLKNLCFQNEGWGYIAEKEIYIDDLVSTLVKKVTGPTSTISAAASTNNNVLTSITLYCCSLSREMFSELLRCSPNLTNLCVQIVLLSNTDFSQSDGVRYLNASVIQVLRLSNDVNREVIDPPLLIHFPKLRTWYTELNEKKKIQLSGLPEQIAVYCPHLEELDFNYADEETVRFILRNTALPRMKKYMFIYYELTRFETLESILCHQETLTNIWLEGSIYEPYSD
ncbi:hypothetical protein BGZ47_011368 [Haplosporangium gracile]|nr:hypothetical protein BGZ47_011368 [Haplosporangium gracile]